MKRSLNWILKHTYFFVFFFFKIHMEYYHNCYSALLNSINYNAVTICGGWGFAAGCLVWAIWLCCRPVAPKALLFAEEDLPESPPVWGLSHQRWCNWVWNSNGCLQAKCRCPNNDDDDGALILNWLLQSLEEGNIMPRDRYCNGQDELCLGSTRLFLDCQGSLIAFSE